MALQWGHGDEAVEELARLEVAGEAWVLQWGHGDEAVEEELQRQILAGVGVASMGPRR